MNSSFDADDSPQVGERTQPVTWTLTELAVAIAVLLIFHSASYVDPDAVAWIPTWILVGAGVVVPQAFFLGYPMYLAQRRGIADVFRVRAETDPDKVMLEVRIAMGVLMGLVAALTATRWIVSLFWPRVTLSSEIIESAANSPSIEFVVFFVGVATFVAPYCEEVFFRGFLQSALRSRMPVVFAAIVQSSIFAAGHTFGAVHGVVVFVLGLVLTFVYEWRKTLLTPILVHGVNNGLASLGFVFLVIINAASPVLGVFGHDHAQGCQVDKVAPGAAAAKAGIAGGDVITKLDDEPVTGFRQLVNALRQRRIGDTVTVGILRNGEPIEFKVVLEKRPPSD